MNAKFVPVCVFEGCQMRWMRQSAAARLTSAVSALLCSGAKGQRTQPDRVLHSGVPQAHSWTQGHTNSWFAQERQTSAEIWRLFS